MKQIKPLKEIRVLDFTRLLPGPLGTHFLSEMGAEVIKVESPKRLDYTRFYQPKMGDTSVLFHLMNNNKESLQIDYESSEGKKLIHQKIKETDILIEQFRPGAMASFGLSFEDVKKLNPKIVYISITGYGQTGALKDKAGHDLNYLALSGLLDLNKDERGKPVIPGFQIADIAGGSYMLLSACTSGLLAQQREQQAQYIDLSLLDAVIPLGAIAHGMDQGGVSYKDMPILSGGLVNYNVYACKDATWIALGALELKFWNSFCEMVAKPDWKTSNEAQLIDGFFDKEKLEALFKEKTRDEWVSMAKEYDICLSPILSQKEVLQQAHTKDRGVFKDTSVKEKTIKTYASPFKVYTNED
ncbi:crotonobetainyl-CoA:carnitine CoA-transferase CaiB-like acyl-CoA transferase [Tenacibaculum adriaticum]|uniref:Crotonobetainyl-CoA:carnitine CoA-transferase CaiB-like acyl-CoA transferase n=1 Tax=Tenacibaculum adriaticum TaxID=413713 RepID=A0A5S5DTC1_9FLAO|nr:CaiB/BaiF CoA-transferase family protein [Tenacibaculum adriaticum]TYP99025.1 crotonobetainyl-CoA:carnitine CoA-transferase CaiB-like acyl-CoA transferase [Tenacibaculum adriaticum]